MHFILAGFTWLSRNLSIVAGLALVLMMVHIVADVVLKFMFNQPIPGTPEIVAYYYMVTAVFFGLAYVEIKGKHITVDLLYNHMPPLMKRIALAIGCLLSALFFSLLAYQTWLDALQAYRIGQIAMGSAALPIWPARFVLPLGFGMVALASVARLISEVMLQQPLVADDGEDFDIRPTPESAQPEPEDNSGDRRG